jgi:hypothetical protein
MGTQSGPFVVHLVGCDDSVPFKQFSTHADAVRFARDSVQSDKAERADVYAVADASDAATAIAAVKMGNAAYVQSCVRHATEAEVDAAYGRTWAEATKAGPRAVLKLLGLPSASPEKVRRRKV